MIAPLSPAMETLLRHISSLPSIWHPVRRAERRTAEALVARGLVDRYRSRADGIYVRLTVVGSTWLREHPESAYRTSSKRRLSETQRLLLQRRGFERGIIVPGHELRSARALQSIGLATRVRKARSEISLSGYPLRRESWRLTAKGRRVLAELSQRGSR